MSIGAWLRLLRGVRRATVFSNTVTRLHGEDESMTEIQNMASARNGREKIKDEIPEIFTRPGKCGDNPASDNR